MQVPNFLIGNLAATIKAAAALRKQPKSSTAGLISKENVNVVIIFTEN